MSSRFRDRHAKGDILARRLQMVQVHSLLSESPKARFVLEFRVFHVLERNTVCVPHITKYTHYDVG